MSKYGLNFLACAGWTSLQTSKAIKQNSAYGQAIQAWSTDTYNIYNTYYKFWDDPYINSLSYFQNRWGVMRDLGASYIRDRCECGKLFNVLQRGSLTGSAITCQEDDDWSVVDALVEFCAANNMKAILTMPELYDYYPGWSEWSDWTNQVNKFYVPYATFIADRYAAYSDTVIIDPRNEGALYDPNGLMQGSVYDAVKSVSTLKVQSQAVICDPYHTSSTWTTNWLAALNTAGKINKFDDVIAISYYPPISSGWNGYTDLAAYVSAVKSALATYGRSDVKVRINEFGIYWSSIYGSTLGDPTWKTTKGPQAITDMITRTDDNADIDSCIYWAGAGCDVQDSIIGLIAQEGAGLWRMDDGAPFTYYPTWNGFPNHLIYLPAISMSPTITVPTLVGESTGFGPRRFVGSQWRPVTKKRWNGSSWVNIQ